MMSPVSRANLTLIMLCMMLYGSIPGGMCRATSSSGSPCSGILGVRLEGRLALPTSVRGRSMRSYTCDSCLAGRSSFPGYGCSSIPSRSSSTKRVRPPVRVLRSPR